MRNDSTSAGSTHQNRKNGKTDPGDRKRELSDAAVPKKPLKKDEFRAKNGDSPKTAKTGAIRGTSLKTTPAVRKEILDRARKSAADAREAKPETPVPELAEMLVRESDRMLSASLSEILMLDFYATAIRAARLKPKAPAEQLRLPGFEHLPASIPVKKGVLGSILDARLPRVRAWYRSLLKDAKNSPKVKEAKGLVDKLSDPINKGATVREALGIDGKSHAASA